ncbi:MAG TPA: zinc ribbon domain-containing protein [Pyrinomonadaceae bacterium]|nr:zinc ribbon domain-containing protein [Pyrinomonadaceae bacterium]
MPIYEYKCLGCDAHLEKMQKVSDTPLEQCEKCGGRLEKQISLSGFQFKGAGWYVTDYAKKSAASAEKSEKSEKSETAEKTSPAESTAKSETASNTSNDTKPAAKTETVSKKE